MRHTFMALFILSFTLQYLVAQETNYERLLKDADYTYDQRLTKKAIDKYDNCILLQPSDYRSYFGRSKCFALLREYDLALQDIQMVIDLNPEYKESYNMKVDILSQFIEMEMSGKKRDSIGYVLECMTFSKASLKEFRRDGGEIELARIVSILTDKELEKWLVIDQFESTEMYRQRTSESNKQIAYRTIQNEVINELAISIPRLQEVKFLSYDADKELVSINYGNFKEIRLVVPPLEAKTMSDALPSTQAKNLVCEIVENRYVIIHSLSLEYEGKSTEYFINQNSGNYEQYNSAIQFREITEVENANIDSPSQSGKKLALIIGNGDYQHGGELLNPENDALSMEQSLQELGFQVMIYENLELNAMRKVIDDFGFKLRNYDVGLFFYAGHGIQANGENFLVPVDAELNTENDVSYNCVNTGRLLAKMEDARNPTNIIILDACRDNPFERSWTRSTKGKGLAFMNAPSGSLVAYATSPGNTASDGAGVNGLYTSAILKFIDNPDLSILEMFQEVRRYVRTQSSGQQTPWETTSLEGNFFFVPSDN